MAARFYDSVGRGYIHGRFEDKWKEINQKINPSDEDLNECTVEFIQGKYIKERASDDQWIEDWMGEYSYLIFDNERYYKVWIYQGTNQDHICYIEPYNGKIYDKRNLGYFVVENMESVISLNRKIEDIEEEIDSIYENIKKKSKTWN